MVSISVVFVFFWNILDIFFSSINLFITQLFSYIPASAIQFLIGILCYSLLAFITWANSRAGDSNKRIAYKLVYIVSWIMIILFAIWRAGFVTMIENKITPVTISEMIINIAYVLVAILLVVSFAKKIPWLKKFMLFFLWFMFTLFTFIIGPYVSNEITLSTETLVTYLVVVALFCVPNVANGYKKMKKSG